MLDDRLKDGFAVETMIRVRPPHALDESLLLKDVLRCLVRGLGNRHPIGSARTVLKARRNELMCHSMASERLGDA